MVNISLNDRINLALLSEGVVCENENTPRDIKETMRHLKSDPFVRKARIRTINHVNYIECTSIDDRILYYDDEGDLVEKSDLMKESAADSQSVNFPEKRNINKTKLDPDQYTTTPPAGCPFKVGDVVTYTNEFDVVFKNQVIYGFALKEDWLHGTDYVYTEGGAYWFPNNIDSFKLQK